MAPALCPLEADAFLRWGPRAKGTHPLTVDDFWFELVLLCPDLTPQEVREMFEHAAKRERARQMGFREAPLRMHPEDGAAIDAAEAEMMARAK